MHEIDTHMETAAYTGLPDECGDTGIISTGETSCFMALVDALGHGKAAFEAASAAKAFLAQNTDRPLTQVISGLNDSLKGTRGAVAGVCRLDIPTGRLTYSCMGNISMRIFGSRRKRLVGRDGVLGYMIPTPREGETNLVPGDLLVLYSDGIRDHFDPVDIPGLFSGTAREIVRRFMTSLNKGTDDASCMVLRVLP